jgi:hypothetical protein
MDASWVSRNGCVFNLITTPHERIIVSDRPTRRKIAIIGYTSHKQLAPWNDPEWELWSLNDHYLDLPIFHMEVVPFDRLRWFQFHPWRALRDWDKYVVRDGDMIHPGVGPEHPRDPEHLLWLQDAGKHFPVYLREAHEKLPNCLAYPYQEVYEYFGNNYFTNSITFMIGLAIMELTERVTLSDGREIVYAKEGAELGVWGVDMMVSGDILGAGSEYGYQRPSCEWALGWARGCGLEVHIPDSSDLCKTAFPYGDEEEFYFRPRIAEYVAGMEQRRILAVNTRTEARDAEMQAIGAKSAMEWLYRSHMPGDVGFGQVPVAHGHRIPQ